nr:hypothetical protein [uncultured Porphyromonas sp.]
MSNNRLSRLESPAVQGYISMLQGIINRMAGNSASCKTWTVTLVAALLALLVGKQIQIYILLICLILVVLLLFVLDCYYLGLERITIGIQKDFLKSLSKDSEEEYINQLYDVSKLANKKLQKDEAKEAMRSLSTLPFYSFVALIALIVLILNCI